MYDRAKLWYMKWRNLQYCINHEGKKSGEKKKSKRKEKVKTQILERDKY